jgi:FtsZ-binding cell division protein ZapB
LRLEVEIEAIRKRKSNFEETRQTSMKKLQQTINDLKKFKSKDQIKWQEELNSLIVRFSKYESALIDGYDLGLWYKKLGITSQ